MSQKIYETRAKGENETIDSAVKLVSSLSEDVVNVLRVLGVQVEQLINLARYNPQFGAVIGIISTNILSHKIDWLHWQHQELVCLDCNNFTVSGNPSTPGQVTDSSGNILGNIVNGFLQIIPGGQFAGSLFQGVISLGQFYASHGAPAPSSGPGSSSSAGHMTAYVWVPGIIDQSANLIITGIIIASFGISAAGALIGDITNITKISQNSGATPPNPTDLVRPVPPNVEAGSQIKTMQTFNKGTGPEELK